ncbi:MAG: hypothetical protein OEV49_04780 [candidate division Zixibacteria bacterium]|nr:hypothetical protein [candidate division Zixibacteria bacterium]MDH3938477.1 hypothetical protein [candidate division Zixibacteria bacterium]MDH4032423.1 hypothetical protein [candidate division Zixibacteria bacterium]
MQEEAQESKGRILWLDNDASWLTPYVEKLEMAGYEVTTVNRVSQAEEKLCEFTYDLLILDVMIPTKNTEEEKKYPASKTDSGYDTGLVFYRLMKSKLDASGTSVLVLTTRLDKKIADDFTEALLPAGCFSTRLELKDVGVFLAKVEQIMPL